MINESFIPSPFGEKMLEVNISQHSFAGKSTFATACPQLLVAVTAYAPPLLMIMLFTLL